MVFFYSAEIRVASVPQKKSKSNNDRWLFKAVMADDPVQLKTLIDAGGDMNAENNNGRTLLGRAEYR